MVVRAKKKRLFHALLIPLRKTTRSSTNSLPAKRPAEEEENHVPPSKARRVTSSNVTTNSAKKAQAKTRTTAKAQPGQDELDDPSFEDAVFEPNQVEPPPTKEASAKPKKCSAKKSATKGKARAKNSEPTAHPAEAPNPDSQNSLLSLPPELRNEIYSLALVKDTPITVSTSLPYLKEPALLAVNQQMRSETLPIWYSENTFQINGSSPAVKLLRSLSAEKLRLLKALRINTGESMRMDYAEDRIKQLIRAFGSNGLSKQTVRFTTARWPSVWLSLADIKRIKREDATRATFAQTENHPDEPN